MQCINYYISWEGTNLKYLKNKWFFIAYIMFEANCKVDYNVKPLYNGLTSRQTMV